MKRLLAFILLAALVIPAFGQKYLTPVCEDGKDPLEMAGLVREVQLALIETLRTLSSEDAFVDTEWMSGMATTLNCHDNVVGIFASAVDLSVLGVDRPVLIGYNTMALIHGTTDLELKSTAYKMYSQLIVLVKRYDQKHYQGSS